jgi:long-chain acyl-CoA synthetase
MSIVDRIRQARARHPRKKALIVEDRHWTYEQLDEITDQIGASLLRRGIRPGDRVALHFANGAEIVFGYYACFKIGAVAVPLNIRLKGPEIEYIVNHCGVRFFLGHADLFHDVQAVRANLQSVEAYLLAGDQSAFPETESFGELTKGPVAGMAFLRMLQTAPYPSFPRVTGDAIAVIMYTSGTTARPKGVTHSHATLDQLSADCSTNIGLHGEQLFGCFVPLCHMSGFGLQMLAAFHLGATLLVVPRFEPEAVLRALEEHRANVIFGLPMMYNALVHCPNASEYDLSSLEVCLAGGDAVRTELQRQFKGLFGVGINELHGMTEVCPCFVNTTQDLKKVGSFGQPVVGVSARLVDDLGRDVAPGDVGEILIKSKATMVGYWEDPEATAAALQDGWLRTGDLARLDEDGYYWFVGRKKQIIIRGGSNISPIEVEEAIGRHPSVKEVGVVGAPDATWGEIVQAYVTLKDGALTSEPELQWFLRDRIAAYKIPAAIYFLTELPKGLTGKIDRRALRDRAAAPQAEKAA